MLKKILLIALCVVAVSSQQRECVAPKEFTSAVITYDFVTKFYRAGKLYYDAYGERLRLFEESYGTKGGRDSLALFREHKSYVVNTTTGKCEVHNLDYDFRPITSGSDSRFIGDEIIGTVPGDGVILSSFDEKVNGSRFEGEIFHTFTAHFCLPVSEAAYGKYEGKEIHFHRKYYNVVTQIEDPNIFEIPEACKK